MNSHDNWKIWNKITHIIQNETSKPSIDFIHSIPEHYQIHSFIPRMDKEFQVHVDALNYAIGATLA